MNDNTKNKIKEVIKSSIRNYFQGREVKTNHVLDSIFPNERRIRSLMGGLETSLGTTLWEPLAKLLASENGFDILDKGKFLMPETIPQEISEIITSWESKRIKPKMNLSLEGYIRELREISYSIDKNNIKFTKLTAGEGIDIWLKKDNVEYAFDIKTNQINQSGGLKFNRTLMDWYAYRIINDSQIKFEARIAFPFNPYKKSWWKANGSRAYPLKQFEDAWVQDEFWDFISGEKGTWDFIEKIFNELREEKFGEQFHDIFYKD